LPRFPGRPKVILTRFCRRVTLHRPSNGVEVFRRLAPRHSAKKHHRLVCASLTTC
jgi:hypothetical protein